MLSINQIYKSLDEEILQIRQQKKGVITKIKRLKRETLDNMLKLKLINLATYMELKQYTDVMKPLTHKDKIETTQKKLSEV